MQGFAPAAGRRLACFVRAQPLGSVSSIRPYYGEYAWAYDLLTDRPVADECEFICARLSHYGIRPPASVLDAGCGTGRYAICLANSGYVVTGIDMSSALIAVANERRCSASGALSLREDDILTHSVSEPYDAVLCRGVLNDFTESQDRAEAFEVFARALRPGGILILDVREWAATVDRKTRQPIVEKRIITTRGALSYWSSARLDRTRQLLRITERHTLTSERGENVSRYDFAMRCWTKDELSINLLESGFVPLECFGGYDALCDVGATDRLVVVAVHETAP